MIETFSQDILAKKTSAQEIAKHSIANAKKLNKRYNSFISFCDELALERARIVDLKVRQGKPLGKLAGVPIAVKDNILVKDYIASAGSRMLSHYKASFHADAVRFLLQEDALIIGKTNMDEFAMGSSSETSAFGAVKNHVDTSLVAGGSSGGSAVAVGCQQVAVALGSDTGGSIRQPASFTGTVGLKPTYGRVSRFGLIAMASSLDQIGVFSQTVQDGALLLEVISGVTEFDSTHAKQPYDHTRQNKNFSTYTIGVPKQYFGKGLDVHIKQAITKLITLLERNGVKIVSLSMPLLEYALACYYILMPAEASSNLARYDGMRYGSQPTSQASDQKFEYLSSRIRAQGFGSEVTRRIMLGTYVLSAGYIDKYYLQAQKVRAAVLEEYRQAFNNVDVILGPTSPTFPFKRKAKLNDPLAMYLSDIYTVAPNLAGLPAISLPLKDVALPAGVQLIARQFDEQTLFSLGKAIESLS